MTTRKTPRNGPRKTSRSATDAAAPLSLALQGGGSHGAFTWGVLDRLLDEDDAALPIDAACGTSAGALNAAVVATAWAEGDPGGGRKAARDALRAFWRDVASARGCFGAPSLNPWAALAHFNPFGAELPLGVFNLDHNPVYAWYSQFTRNVSPYEFGVGGPNLLAEVLRRHVREDALRGGPLKVFVAATEVQTGRPRIFSGEQLSIDALLASACLPQLFRAVEIDGQPYWDGGYGGNPALWPLIYEADAIDLLLVKINPLYRPGIPDTAAEIADRVNEITFNAGLVAEMRAIHFVQRLVAEGRVDASRYKALRVHMVADDEGLAPLQPSSKLNTDLRFLERLHALGRAAAERWLIAHRADVGRRSSLDIEATFLAPRTA